MKKEISALSAMRWAKRILARYEGEGHIFTLSRKCNDDSLICCSFSKSFWPSDYSGPYNRNISEAIITSVETYLKETYGVIL